jgi:dolichyl-phosphate beta-glucosyltransferase
MGGQNDSRRVWLVVPCYQEAARLDVEALAGLTADPRIGVLLVDDGSTDGTAEVLRSVASREGIEVLTLSVNGGKGEAVRRGALHAMAADPAWIGYLDADLSTPAAEVARLVDAVDRDDVDVVIASRVAILGHHIERSPWRHYTGRVFATGASLVLSKPIYDTQCGAKLFRNGPALSTALASPFRSRWAFDVELLGRLDRLGVEPERFVEIPLRSWSDAAGSKRGLLSSVRATMSLVGIRRDLSRWPRA